MGEHAARALDEAVHVFVWPEWSSPFGINGEVPRPQPAHAQMRAPAFLQPPDCGQHRRLDRLVKAKAIVGRVVETIFLSMRVVAEVVEPRIRGDPLTQVIHAVEESRQHVALIDVRLEHLAERALAYGAVVFLQEWRHLRRCLLLALPIDRHGADRLGPFGRQLREVRMQRHVGRAEDLHLVAKSLDHGLEAGPDVTELHEAPLQLRPRLLGAWCDLAAEPQLRLFALAVGGVDCVCEVRQR